MDSSNSFAVEFIIFIKDNSSAVFALFGILIGIIPAALIEHIKGKNLRKTEKMKLLYTQEATGLANALLVCDKIIDSYDSEDDQISYMYSHIKGDIELLKPYYHVFGADIIKQLEEFYGYSCSLKYINHPDYNSSNTKDFFENHIVEKTNTLKNNILSQIESMRTLKL
jgi:hypothetical protein